PVAIGGRRRQRTGSPDLARLKFPLKSQSLGGEGGIRTLGPPQGGQRFSRPPRSTAPAPLHPNGGKGLSWPRRRTKPEIGTRLAPVKGAGALPPLMPSPRSYRRWRRGAPVGA